MVNRSKQRGTAFESLLRDYLKEQWSPIIERMPLSGNLDKGDLSNFRIGSKQQHLICCELKARSQLALNSWVEEANAEAKNYGAVAGICVHKRKGKGQPGDQYVTLTVDAFLAILHAAAS